MSNEPDSPSPTPAPDAADLVDLATGAPVVVDPDTGAVKLKNRRGRPPKNPPRLVAVTPAERTKRLAAGDAAPAPEEPAEETISLVEPATPPEEPAPAEPAAPAPEAPAADSLAAAAGVDPEALLRARREAALRMKQGLDSLASSVNAMNAFFAASPRQQAAAKPGQPQQQRQQQDRQRQQQQEQQRRQQQDRQRQQQQEQQRRQQQQQQQQRQSQQQQQQPNGGGRPPEPPRETLPPIRVADLQSLSADELRGLAQEQGLLGVGTPMGAHETVFALLQEHVRRGGSVEGEGCLDVWQDGCGFLRSPLADFKPAPEDIFVPQSVIQRGGLRPGDRVICRTRPADRGQRDRHFVATELLAVNGLPPDKARRAVPFSSLPVAAAPARLLPLRGDGAGPIAAAIDRLAPLAFGSRAIVALPRRADHAAVAREIAARVAANHPGAALVAALFNATPEARAAFAAEPAFRDRRATLLATDFDDGPDKALQAAALLADAARRRAEGGEEVVVVVDTMTALVRAFGMIATNQQGTLTDGVDGRALQKARRLFATGRAFDGVPGSITVVALFEHPAAGAPDASVAGRILDEFVPAATAFLGLAAPLVPDPAHAWSSAEPLLADADRAAADALRAALRKAAGAPDAVARALAAAL